MKWSDIILSKYYVNHLNICSLVYLGNTAKALDLFDKNLNSLILESGYEHCKTFISALNYGIYNYILVKEGVSLHKCCYSNSTEVYNSMDIDSLIEMGHKIINSYSFCKDYLAEKYPHPEIKKAILYIHKHIHEDISLDDICSIITMNKSYFCRLFKNYTKETFIEYVNKTKINSAKHLLSDSDFTLVDIANCCGFNNYCYFCKMFKKCVGMSPMQYKKAES